MHISVTSLTVYFRQDFSTHNPLITLAESSIRSLFLCLKSAQKEYLQLVTTLLEMVKFILITGIMDDSFVEVQSAVH